MGRRTVPVLGPVGRWLIAGTPLTEPYPCRCYRGKACGMRCPCAGRTDAAQMPTRCCARRAHGTAQRTAQQSRED